MTQRALLLMLALAFVELAAVAWQGDRFTDALAVELAKAACRR